MLVYSWGHGLIDAACAGVVFSILSRQLVTASDFFCGVIVYNILAFGGQSLLGLLIDRYRAPRASAIIGCFLVATSFLFINFWTPLVFVLAGVGNALYHLGGGTVSLNLTPGKASAPGIFVAPGALGLLIGTVLGKAGQFNFVIFGILVVATAFIIYFTKIPVIDYARKKLINSEKTENIWDGILLLMLTSIAIRSLVGLSVAFPWKSDLALLVYLTIGVVLGKALGGILGDKFGWMRVGVGALVLSVPLMIGGVNVPALGIAGALLFQMTMPITLVIITGVFPGRPAFAFGLTCLALIVGALPVFTPFKAFFSSTLSVVVFTMISAISLYFGLKMFFKNFTYEPNV